MLVTQACSYTRCVGVVRCVLVREASQDGRLARPRAHARAARPGVRVVVSCGAGGRWRGGAVLPCGYALGGATKGGSNRSSKRSWFSADCSGGNKRVHTALVSWP